MKRIKLFIAATLALFISIQISAQSTLTVKGGLLMSNVSVNGIGEAFTPDKAYLPGWQIGLFTELPMSNQLSFAPGIQLAEKGFMAKEGLNVNLFQVPVELGVKAETRIKYLQAPLWLKYNMGNGPIKGYITGGPTLGYALDGQIQTKANFILDFNVSKHNLNLSKDMYNRFEVGAGIGGGVEFDTGRGSILFEASYQHAFTDILSDPIVDVRVRNQGFGLSIGYNIPLH